MFAQFLPPSSVFPLDAGPHILRDVARHADRPFCVLVDRDHDDIGCVDRLACAVKIFYIGVDAHFHGGIAHIGDPPGQDDEIIQMRAFFKNEVVDTGLFQATMFLDPTVGLDVCFEATMVMIIAGTIAGLIPAYKASRIRPIEALRAD